MWPYGLAPPFIVRLCGTAGGQLQAHDKLAVSWSWLRVMPLAHANDLRALWAQCKTPWPPTRPYDGNGPDVPPQSAVGQAAQAEAAS